MAITKKPAAKKPSTKRPTAKPAAPRLIEDPATRLLHPAPGVDPEELTVDERVEMARRHIEVAPKLTKTIDTQAKERFEAERTEREKATFAKTKEGRLSMFVIAALGRGYLAAGEASWTPRKDEALVYGQRDAAETSLATLIHRNFAPTHAGVIQIDAALPKPKSAAQQRAEVKKPAPAPTKASKSPRSTAKSGDRSGFVSLKAICTRLKIDASTARKTLRKDGQRAPGGVWEWPEADVGKIERLLNSAN